MMPGDFLKTKEILASLEDTNVQARALAFRLKDDQDKR